MTLLSMRACVFALSLSCAEKPAAIGHVTPLSLPAAPTMATSVPPPMIAAEATTTAPVADAASPVYVADAAKPEATRVRVTNIGMHIGGGPNDLETKAPIANSVAPHFAKFAECYTAVSGLSKTGDFGVDLMIEAIGGRVKVSHPRTSLAGGSFNACVVSVFEGIDFQKPKGGRTMVSYSLRFEPSP
jgi:hypothetical protein